MFAFNLYIFFARTRGQERPRLRGSTGVFVRRWTPILGSLLMKARCLPQWHSNSTLRSKTLSFFHWTWDLWLWLDRVSLIVGLWGYSAAIPPFQSRRIVSVTLPPPHEWTICLGPLWIDKNGAVSNVCRIVIQLLLLLHGWITNRKKGIRE